MDLTHKQLTLISDLLAQRMLDIRENPHPTEQDLIDLPDISRAYDTVNLMTVRTKIKTYHSDKLGTVTIPN